MSRRNELLPFSAFAFCQTVEVKPPESSAPVQYGTSLTAFISRSAESIEEEYLVSDPFVPCALHAPRFN